MREIIKLSDEQAVDVNYYFEKMQAYQDTIERLSVKIRNLETDGIEKIKELFPQVVGRNWTYDDIKS